jgi:RNA polymerase primary sigma factor
VVRRGQDGRSERREQEEAAAAEVVFATEGDPSATTAAGSTDPRGNLAAAEVSSDPVAHYLREMQRSNLLSREGEIAIAKRIVAARLAICHTLLSLPVTHVRMAEWRAGLLSGTLHPREIVDIDGVAPEPRQEAEFRTGEQASANDDGEASAPAASAPLSESEAAIAPLIVAALDKALVAGSEGCRRAAAEGADILDGVILHATHIRALSERLRQAARRSAELDIKLVCAAERAGVPRHEFIAAYTAEGQEPGFLSSFNARPGAAAAGWKRLAQCDAELSRLLEKIKVAVGEIGLAPVELRAAADRLVRAERRYERARDELARSNLRLVVWMARRHVNRGLLLSDLIQEGNIGLMRAVDKFDYRKGFRFSTYASWWVRQSLVRAIQDHGRTIRVPAHLGDTVRKVRKIQQALRDRLGREPTDAEIGALARLEPLKVKATLDAVHEIISLDAPVGVDGASSFGDLIVDDQAVVPLDAAIDAGLRVVTAEVLASLTPREADIVRRRFGVGTGDAETLEEIGARYGVTRERIRQIEAKALNKLRHPKTSRSLRSFLDP